MRFLLIILFNLLGLICLGQNVWVNPEIDCSLRPREKAVKQFPSSGKNQKPKKMESGLIEFNKKMQEEFAHSDIDSAEALEVFRILDSASFIKDESYGMPSPGDSVRFRSFEEIQKTVAIKKISDDGFFILYQTIGCGRKFHWMVIQIIDGHLDYRVPIETWSASYPC